MGGKTTGSYSITYQVAPHATKGNTKVVFCVNLVVLSDIILYVLRLSDMDIKCLIVVYQFIV